MPVIQLPDNISNWIDYQRQRGRTVRAWRFNPFEVIGTGSSPMVDEQMRQVSYVIRRSAFEPSQIIVGKTIDWSDLNQPWYFAAFSSDALHYGTYGLLRGSTWQYDYDYDQPEDCAFYVAGGTGPKLLCFSYTPATAQIAGLMDVTSYSSTADKIVIGTLTIMAGAYYYNSVAPAAVEVGAGTAPATAATPAAPAAVAPAATASEGISAAGITKAVVGGLKTTADTIKAGALVVAAARGVQSAAQDPGSGGSASSGGSTATGASRPATASPQIDPMLVGVGIVALLVLTS